MLKAFITADELGDVTPVPVHAVTSAGFERFLSDSSPRLLHWLKATGFTGREGDLALVPGDEGLGAVILGLGAGRDPHALALFSEKLPSGIYTLGNVPDAFSGERAAFAWAIGTYAFDRYRARARKSQKNVARLVLPADIDGEKMSRIAEGVFLA
jgi:leucyl aminopeptidase